ncbi:hypothetical protein VB779_09460 [Haloarculaceae archaeon H-GB11]|nr:hypothetical protein [Haloarculaceae archaeon H-GB11]
MLTDTEVNNAYEFVTESLGRSAKLETFKKRIRPAHQRLRTSARNGKTITYSDLADAADTDNRRYLSKILDGIGYIEEERGNPPITVLVVHANDGKPADDFLKLLDSLEIQHRYDSDTDDRLIEEVMQEVRSYNWT